MPLDDPTLIARLRRARRRLLFDPNTLARVEIGRRTIEDLLPHRGAMLLIDRIVGADPAMRRLAAHRRVSPDDAVFAGHFPKDPVYPGVLQIEAMGQAALCLSRPEQWTVAKDEHRPQKTGVRLVRIIHGQFIAPVLPGDELLLLAEIIADDGMLITAIGQASSAGRIVSTAAFEVMVDEAPLGAGAL